MPDTNPRFAIVVPKSVTKKAVERNRLRRKGYNQLRSFSLPNKAGIFFYKKEGTQATTQDIKNDLQNILTKVNNEKKT